MRRARIYERTTLESLSVTTAKRKRFIPTPLPLAQKESVASLETATAFSFCNQGESLALPLLALARRLDTTASLFPRSHTTKRARIGESFTLAIFIDRHADKSARNDRKIGFFIQDSRDCGVALCDSKNLGVGVTFGGNDCPQIFRNARMLTQYRIYERR